jgi:hypothetical protein
MTNLLKVLPLAVVMVAGPQIITAILLTTSTKPRQKLFRIRDRSRPGHLRGDLDLLLRGQRVEAEGLYQELLLSNRGLGTSGGPGRCGYLGRARPTRVRAAQMDANLAGRGPQRLRQAGFHTLPGDADRCDDDIHGRRYLASYDSPLWHALGFLLVTALLIAVPLLILLLMGRHADTLMPRLRDWMNANSWLVSEAVIAFFLVMEIRTIAGA